LAKLSTIPFVKREDSMSIFHDNRLIELISKETIAARVKELGQQIAAHYHKASDGLVLVGVLKDQSFF
jgi:hypoxanthine-guanine phosphoribosyltransferase